MKCKKTALRLRELLNENNMKAVELCSKSGVSKGTISQYYNGSHAPSNISADKIANVFNVNPLWVMGFDVDKYQTKNQFNLPSEEFTELDAELLELFHKIPESDQNIIMSMLRRMAN